MVLLATAGLGVGCGKKAPATEAPADAGSMAEASPHDGSEEASSEDDWESQILGGSLAEAEAELDGYEESMLAAGVALPEPVRALRMSNGKSATAAEVGDPAGRCQRICDLSTNICALRDRICDLADEHADQTRYASICERASLDCEQATVACEGCDA